MTSLDSQSSASRASLPPDRHSPGRCPVLFSLLPIAPISLNPTPNSRALHRARSPTAAPGRRELLLDLARLPPPALKHAPPAHPQRHFLPQSPWRTAPCQSVKSGRARDGVREGIRAPAPPLAMPAQATARQSHFVQSDHCLRSGQLGQAGERAGRGLCATDLGHLPLRNAQHSRAATARPPRPPPLPNSPPHPATSPLLPTNAGRVVRRLGPNSDAVA